MEKKIKFITSCLTLTSLASLTACSNETKKQDDTKQILDSIEIVSDLNDIKIELDETYSSQTIEVKCYDKNKKEMESKTQLLLYPTIENDMDISIQNNQIHIGQAKKEGKYTYKLVAINEDCSIISNIKEFNIDVYKQYKGPDSIELIGCNETLVYYPTDTTIEFKLIGRIKDQIIEDFDPASNLSINITSSPGNKTKDLFNSPIFNLEQKDKQISLHISKDIDKTYDGEYTMDINANLISNPEIKTTKSLKLSLCYGLEHTGSKNYYYARDNTASEWYLKSIPSNELEIDKNNVLKFIQNKNVTKIGNNFCTNSGIKTFFKVDLPDNINSIGEYAFYKQEAMSSLYIQNITEVSDYAFAGCSLACTNPEWQLKLKIIRKHAFEGCSELNIKYLPDIEYLGEACLKGISSSQIHFGSNLQIIESEALYNCSNLKDIYISSSNPPQIMGDFIGGTTPSGFKIHVPSSAIDKYRNSSNWSIYSQNLVGDITM